MKGGIQPGSNGAASEQSRAAEEIHRWFILSEKQLSNCPRVEIRKELGIDEMFPEGNNEYSLRKNGKSQCWEADGGWIFVDGKLAGIAECKFQATRENACERAFKYLTLSRFRLDPRRIFVSCYGPGFEKRNGAGSTGPFIDACLAAGVTLLENPTDAEFQKRLESWARMLLSEEGA